jgi:hypothetical protein
LRRKPLQLGQPKLRQASALPLGSGHQPADALMRVAEGHPTLHQVLGQIRRAQGIRLQEPLDPGALNPHMPDETLQDLQRLGCGINGVEDQPLIPLQISIIRQRQTLHHGQKRHQLPDHQARLSAHELKDIRIFLLRHEA